MAEIKTYPVTVLDDLENGLITIPEPQWSTRISNAKNALHAATRLLDAVQTDFPSLDKDCCRALLFRAGELVGDARVLVKDARDDILRRFDK
jgi:hypothetical protein